MLSSLMQDQEYNPILDGPSIVVPNGLGRLQYNKYKMSNDI